MLESYERMLPIAHMIAKTNVEDHISQIVAVEVEPECVNDSIALIDSDKDGRSVTSASFASISKLVLSALIPISTLKILWYVLLSTQPIWPLFDVVIAGQVDMAALLEIIESVKVGQV